MYILPQRYADDNRRSSNCTQWQISIRSNSLTIVQCAPVIILLKLSTDRREAPRDMPRCLSETAELLVRLDEQYLLRHICQNGIKIFKQFLIIYLISVFLNFFNCQFISNPLESLVINCTMYTRHRKAATNTPGNWAALRASANRRTGGNGGWGRLIFNGVWSNIVDKVFIYNIFGLVVAGSVPAINMHGQ